MSTIDPNSTATLNKILEKIGVKSNDDTSSKILKIIKTSIDIKMKSYPPYLTPLNLLMSKY